MGIFRGSTAGYISRVDITFLTVSANLPPLSTTYSKEDIRETALHEIGHALGLAGHSLNPNDVMYFASASIERKISELSSRDKNTIRKLYANEHQVAN